MLINSNISKRVFLKYYYYFGFTHFWENPRYYLSSFNQLIPFKCHQILNINAGLDEKAVRRVNVAPFIVGEAANGVKLNYWPVSRIPLVEFALADWWWGLISVCQSLNFHLEENYEMK